MDDKKNPARQKFLPMLSPFVDGELTPEERVQVEQHLAANKDSAMQVADFRAASGLMRLSMEELADQEDFSDFANQVMARVTPEKLPLFSRLSLELSELFTWKRPMMVTSLATAAVVALISVPMALKFGGQSPGYANERVEVQTVKVDQDARVAPVVMETDQGDAVIWMVDVPDKDKKDDPKKDKTKDGVESEEELGVDPNQQPKKGDL